MLCFSAVHEFVYKGSLLVLKAAFHNREMKMRTLTLIAMSFFIGLTSYAIECPKITLACDLQGLNQNQGTVVLLSREANYVGINNDEPSEAPNECEASLYFNTKETGTDASLYATFSDNQTLYLYAGVDYGVKDPQFSVQNAAKGQEFSLSYKAKTLVCRLK